MLAAGRFVLIGWAQLTVVTLGLQRDCRLARQLLEEYLHVVEQFGSLQGWRVVSCASDSMARYSGNSSSGAKSLIQEANVYINS